VGHIRLGAVETIAFSLRNILGTTLKTLALRAHDTGLELAYSVPPDVPDALQGDPGRLRQVLVNLVGIINQFYRARALSAYAAVTADIFQTAEAKR